MKKTTAQEASGATIAAWDDLKVDPFFTRRAMAGSSRIDTACLVERLAPCAGQEAVDAAGPVDAQTAPTGPWKTADGFPQAPTAIERFSGKRRQRTARACARVRSQTILRPPTAWPLFKRSSVAAFERSVTSRAHANGLLGCRR